MKAPINIADQLNLELKKIRCLLGCLEPGTHEKNIVKHIVKVLETKPIQALEFRYQLGLANSVYGGEQAMHTRLDHTIGVVAKCIVASDVINKNTENKHLQEIEDKKKYAEVNNLEYKDVDDEAVQLTETDVRELVVAAALHDCGHFPVSHATERAFLTAKGLTKGLSHEERILPFIVNRNPYFEDLRNLVLAWDGFDENSFYRIACIISPSVGDEYERSNRNFIRPKKAIQQLLVSDIDMDRLDYIIRDATELNYNPVKLISDKLIKYINGLSLERYKTLNQINSTENVELCLSEDLKENVFYLLVSRVLLYKYIYFSEKVRCFEAILTYLVGTLIENDVALEPLKLMAMSDEYFINTHLEYLVSYIDDSHGLQTRLKEKYINVLKKDRVERFKKLDGITDEQIVNPRLKEEFQKNIHKRSYIDNLRTYLFSRPNELGKKLEEGDILIDVFHIKTGGGELLVKEKNGGFKTLSFYMNGSNMHRLCSELRLDIYMKSDLGEKKKEFIKNELDKFFKEIF